MQEYIADLEEREQGALRIEHVKVALTHLAAAKKGGYMNGQGAGTEGFDLSMELADAHKEMAQLKAQHLEAEQKAFEEQAEKFYAMPEADRAAALASATPEQRAKIEAYIKQKLDEDLVRVASGGSNQASAPADYSGYPSSDDSCVNPEARISLADGTTKRAMDIEVGDAVLSFEGRTTTIAAVLHQAAKRRRVVAIGGVFM